MPKFNIALVLKKMSQNIDGLVNKIEKTQSGIENLRTAIERNSDFVGKERNESKPGWLTNTASIFTIIGTIVSAALAWLAINLTKADQRNQDQITALRQLIQNQQAQTKKIEDQTDQIIKVLNILQEEETTLLDQRSLLGIQGKVMKGQLSIIQRQETRADQATYEQSIRDVWDFFKTRDRFDELRSETVTGVWMSPLNLSKLGKVVDGYRTVVEAGINNPFLQKDTLSLKWKTFLTILTQFKYVSREDIPGNNTPAELEMKKDLVQKTFVREWVKFDTSTIKKFAEAKNILDAYYLKTKPAAK